MPHQLVIESWIGPALEPDETACSAGPAAEFFSVLLRDALGPLLTAIVPRELPMRQVAVPRCDRGREPNIQSVG